jgi:hypothetical protein
LLNVRFLNQIAVHGRRDARRGSGFARVLAAMMLISPIQPAFAALTIETDVKTDAGIRRTDRPTPVQSSGPKSSLSLPHEPDIPIIKASGIIEAGDSFHLRAALARIRAQGDRIPDQPLAIVELDSPGGDMLEGLNLGYLFREFDVMTSVRKGAMCLSACAMAFLGGTVSHLPPDIVPGRKVEVGAIVGFHNFYLNPQSPVGADAKTFFDAVSKGFSIAQSGAAGFARYVTFMGIEPGFIARILVRPVNTWEYVDTTGQFIEFNACPMGVTTPQIAPETIAGNICSNAFGPNSSVRPEDVHAVTEQQFKRHLIERIRGNAAGFRIKRETADKVAKALAGGDDRLVDEAYEGLRDANVPLPNLLGQSFRVNGRSEHGEYELICHINISSEEPRTFDLVIEGPGGLGRSPQSTPSACPTLFVFKRDDAINPSPVVPPQWLPPTQRH